MSKHKAVERLEELVRKVEAGEPIPARRVTRYQTPDGPMHTSEPILLVKGKPVEIWSTTPPSEDGWYWVRYGAAQATRAVRQRRDGKWGLSTSVKRDADMRMIGYQFGPLVPTAEELVSMRETMELFRRELMEKAKEKGEF